MVYEKRTRWVVVAGTCFAGFLGGCERELPPATAPVALLPAPAPNQGSIVFVRPNSQCDRSDYSVVVDDRGHFVGNVAPGTRVGLSVSPGTYTFYGWSSLDLRDERNLNFNASTAVRVNVGASETRYVTLTVYRPVYDCQEWPIVDMHSVRTKGELADLQNMLDATKAVEADRVAGQVALDAKPASLQTNLDLGRWKLKRLDEIEARDNRREAMEAEGTR